MDYSFSVPSVARASMEQAVIDFHQFDASRRLRGDRQVQQLEPEQGIGRAGVHADRRRRPETQALIQAVSSDYPGVGTNIFDAVDRLGRAVQLRHPCRCRPDRGQSSSSPTVARTIRRPTSTLRWQQLSMPTFRSSPWVSAILRPATSQQILNNLAERDGWRLLSGPGPPRTIGAAVRPDLGVAQQRVPAEHSRRPSPTATPTRSRSWSPGRRLRATANFTRCTTLFVAGRARHDVGSRRRPR